MPIRAEATASDPGYDDSLQGLRYLLHSHRGQATLALLSLWKCKADKKGMLLFLNPLYYITDFEALLSFA